MTLRAVALAALTLLSLAVAGLPAQATHVEPSEVRWACGPGGSGSEGHPDACGIDPVGGPPAADPAGEATWGDPWIGDEEVLGVVAGGEAGAVPLKMLAVHEVANTELGGIPVAITYCPLCGSGLTFERVVEVDGQQRELDFSASGFLWENDLVMWDPNTGTLWNQIRGEPIGSLVDRRVRAEHPTADLTVVSTQVVEWGAFRDDHPDARMLQPVRNDYRDPYADYYENCQVGVSGERQCEVDGIHAKARVVGVELGDTAIAYPVDRVDRAGGEIVHDVADRSLRVSATSRGATSVVDADSGEEVPSVISFWFAWKELHPDTVLWGEGPAGPSTPGPGTVGAVAALGAAAWVLAQGRRR